MHFPADQIAVSDPRCPSCGQATATDDPACLSCGYSFEFATKLLPHKAPDLRKFIDREGVLSREDIKRGQKALNRLREFFPQVTVCTCVARIPEEISVEEFGFWLFNQSSPNGPRLAERRLHSILLCIDSARGEASLTVGYGLDPFVDDSSLATCLHKIRRHLASEDYGKALHKLCTELRAVLRKGLAKTNQSYEELKHEQRADRQPPPQAIPTGATARTETIHAAPRKTHAQKP